MASFTNLALSLSQLGTKYLNQAFVVSTRQVRDPVTHVLQMPEDYTQLACYRRADGARSCAPLCRNLLYPGDALSQRLSQWEEFFNECPAIPCGSRCHSVLFWVIFVAGRRAHTSHSSADRGRCARRRWKMSVATALLIPVAASLPPDIAWYYLGRIKGGRCWGFCVVFFA